MKGRAGCQRETRAPLHLVDEPFETAGIDGVLEPRVLAIAAIAEIALRGHDGFGDRQQLFGRDEADHVTQARVGGRLAVRGAKPAS